MGGAPTYRAEPFGVVVLGLNEITVSHAALFQTEFLIIFFDVFDLSTFFTFVIFIFDILRFDHICFDIIFFDIFHFRPFYFRRYDVVRNSPRWRILRMSCLLHWMFAPLPPSQKPHHRTSPSGSRFRIHRGSPSIIVAIKIESEIFALKTRSVWVWVFVQLLIASPLT